MQNPTRKIIIIVAAVVIPAFILGSMLMSFAVSELEKATQTSDAINARSLVTVLAMDYKNGAAIPQTLEELIEKQPPQTKALFYEKGTTKPRWIYHPENFSSEDPQAIILESLPDKKDGRIIACVGGSAQYICAKKNQASSNP